MAKDLRYSLIFMQDMVGCHLWGPGRDAAHNFTRLGS